MFAIHLAATDMFDGWIAVRDLQVSPETEIALWPVLEWKTTANGTIENLTLPENLGIIIQDFMTNFTLSLIGLRSIGDFAAQPIMETVVPATVISHPAIYTYSRVALWQSYAAALGVSAICVILGGFMLFKNGIVGKMSFSQLLVTTRNPELDKISEGQGLGGGYITDRVLKTKVKYGKLVPTEQVGFGLENEIVSFKTKTRLG